MKEYDDLDKIKSESEKLHKKVQSSLAEMALIENNLISMLEKHDIDIPESFEDNEYYDEKYLNTHLDPKELGKNIGTISSFKDFNNFAESRHSVGGSFRGIKLGNIITIRKNKNESYDFIVADFDDASIALFPISNMCNAKMNEKKTTNGGYDNSCIRRRTISVIYEKFKYIFKRYIHYMDLPDEYQLYGQQMNQIEPDNPFIDEDSMMFNQLSLFKNIQLKELIRKKILTAESFWMQGIANRYQFCYVSGDGYPGYCDANCVEGVRPVVYINLDYVLM